MEKKKAVCLLRSNPIRPDSRVEKIAWSLSKAGFHVHILAWDRDSTHAEENGSIEVVGTKIPITWLGFKANYGEGLKSLRPFLQFQFHMCKWLHKHRKEYSIIHACDFDTAFFSYIEAFFHKKKFVYDIFDFLYGEPRSFFQKCIKEAQIQLINHADATIICTEEREKQIAGATPKRLAVIHNTPFREQMGTEEQMIQGQSKKVKIAYVGILADERLLTGIGNCIERHPEVELHIAGFGYLQDHFTQLAAKCDNIFFYGRIPYKKALQLENECDVMLAIYNPADENCRFAAPNKFYESLMLGKPVIMVKGTGMSNVVQENQIGQLIDFSEESFEIGLAHLLACRNEWQRMTLRMKQLYNNKYNWETMDKRLLALYDELELT